MLLTSSLRRKTSNSQLLHRFEMAVSKYVLRPEDVPVTLYEDWFTSEPAQRYDFDKGHRALWASTMHNTQLRLQFVDMAARCHWWAAYFDFVLSACQATLLHFVHNGELLQPLLEQLLTMAIQLKPAMLLTMANLQLPLPVLMQQYGILITDRENVKSLRKLIAADYTSTMALVTAVGCQNGLLISYIEQQQFYAKQMRELCSTRRVAGLLQALVGQHQLTHLLPDDTIIKTLRTLLTGRRIHGCLGFATLIDAETVNPAAGSVPSAEPPSMSPQARAAGAPAAASPIKLPTCGLIAQDSLVSSLAVSSAPLTFNVPLTATLVDQKPMLAFPTVVNLPVLGLNELILPDGAMLPVPLPIPFSLSVSYDSLDAGAQHQDLTDIRRDNHAAITAMTPEIQPDTPEVELNTPELQPEEVTLPEPTTTITTVDKPMEATCSNKVSSWRRLFCVRFGKTIAATGIVVASMLVLRPGALKRL